MEPDSELSDGQLARHVMERSVHAAGAEAELCRRFAPRVRAYGLRHLRTEDAANELLQKVLMLVIEKLRQRELREADSIASFVLGTARNLALSQRREQPQWEPLSHTDEVWYEPAPPPTLDSQRAASCMQELPERERTVVALSFLEELGAAEIAQAVGISAGNVRVLRHRALAALRACFERQAVPA